jgi:hypothetical protein
MKTRANMTHYLDAECLAILEAIPPFPFSQIVRPKMTEANQEKKKFLATGQPPHFSYPRAECFDVVGYLLALDKAKKQLQAIQIHPIIKDWYFEKISELQLRAKLIACIQKKDDDHVTALSIKLYGEPLCSLHALSKEFTQSRATSKRAHIHRKKVDASALKHLIEKRLADHHLTDWTVALTNGLTLKLKHGKSKTKPRILIPKKILVSHKRAQRLLVHEIDIHAKRTENGRKSAIALFGRGLPHYLKTEEGLAVYAQHQAFPHSKNRIPGFFDAWAVCLARSEDFQQTFETLKKAKQKMFEDHHLKDSEKRAEDAAWRICLRTYRGISHPNKKGLAFVQGHIYRDGYLEIAKAVQKEGPEILEKLMVGNVGLGNLEDISHMGLACQAQAYSIAKTPLRRAKRSS